MTHMTGDFNYTRCDVNDAMTHDDGFTVYGRNARARKRIKKAVASYRVIASLELGMEFGDPAEWAPEFHGWAITECIWNDRAHASIDSLHESLSHWCTKHQSVPCYRKTFEHLLTTEGFSIRNDFIVGLMLRGD
jgi:hypothetical protein